MKRNILLPLLAIVFAVLSAFASAPPQNAWYDSNGATAEGGVQDVIDIPTDRPCNTSATDHVCKIVINSVEFNAYNSKANAEDGGGTGTAGLLKYNN